MSRCLPAVAALVVLMLSDPAAVAAASGSASPGYEPQGPDEGYDNMKADTEQRSAPDELAAGAALVKQEKFSDAIPHLEAARKKNPHDVNTLVYLGFAHRMLAPSLVGDAQTAEYDKALDCYQQALAIDPDNRLVHEYLGKLYLLMRKYDLAASELKTLEGLCGTDCAERTALAQAVAANPPPATPAPAAQPAHTP